MANNSELIGDDEAFAQLVSGDFSATNGHFEDDLATNVAWSAFYAPENNVNLTSVNLPNVTTVGISSFANNAALATVSMPKLRTIDQHAFNGCSVLDNVNFPLLTSVATYGLANCTSLSNINIPLAASTGTYAFTNCTSLSNTNFPALTTLDQYTFNNTGLTKVTDENFPVLRAIHNAAFQGCANLTLLNSTSLTTINGTFGYFRNCTQLAKAILPNAVITSSSSQFFNGDTALSFVDLGAITGIPSAIFGNCSSLVTLILRPNSVIPIANIDAFTGTKYAANGAGGAYVYVPRSLISSYQSATNWNTLYTAHSDMFRALEDYTVDGTITGAFNESLLS